MITVATAIPLASGREISVMDETASAAGTKSVKFAIEADSVLVSLWVGSISGSLDVSVLTYGQSESESMEIITFPTITAPTSSIQLKKAASALQHIIVTVTYTGACDFNIRARGANAEGASVKILGQNAGRNYSTIITTTPSLIIPVALIDRVGIALHNKSSEIVYIGFTESSTTVTDGWEMQPGEKLGLDIASGVELYGMVLTGTATMKILEAGT